MKLHTERIIHLPWSHLGDWKKELKEQSNCIAVLHADEAITKGFSELHDYIVENNIVLAIENTRRNKHTRIGWSKKECFNLIKDLPTKNYGLCYDTAHGQIAGEDIYEWSDVANRIVLFHFADSKGCHCGQPIGAGEVDFNKVFKFMREHFKKNMPIIWEIE